MAKRWLMATPVAEREVCARQWGVPPLVAQLLLNRGLTTDGPAATFLAPQLKHLSSPQLLPGAMGAADRIVKAIHAGEKIVLYGDYDVDGTTGVAILWHMLTRAGADVSFYVPHRIDEGYGLNLEALRRHVADGAGLIISVDCGITAVDEAAALRQAGVGLIITDHHVPHAVLPDVEFIVHPTVGGAYPNPNLCGSGVAFMLAWAVAQKLSGSERVESSFRTLLVDLLPLAALGTIADVVPLVGENRIIARHGLEGLSSSRLPGVRALIDSAGLRGEKIDDYHVGFKLAPRINAAGRMGHARLAVELFTRADADRGREIAAYLEEHNRARQSVERKIFKSARGLIDERNLASDARRAIVLASSSWHSGVIGIVAARLVEHYVRPTILIALSGGVGQGSGRSVPALDLGSALAACDEHLVSYGGHAMAAGLRIAEDRVASFTERFVEVANNRLTGDDLVPRLRLDAEVRLDELALATVEHIRGLGPFGIGNPKPKLATDWIELAAEPRCVGKAQDHLQASFTQNGLQMKAIGFGLGSIIEELKYHRRCRVAFEPIINDFNGRRSVEMQMLDLQFPDGTAHA